MDNLAKNLKKISNDGFAIIQDIYTPYEIESIIATIDKIDQFKDTFRKTGDLFAIRRFLIEVPDAKSLIFNNKLKSLIDDLFGFGYFNLF